MAHKDWKGPGVYDCWYCPGEWVERKHFELEGFLNKTWTYKKLEDFTPPNMPEPEPEPKPELEDGVYLTRHLTRQIFGNPMILLFMHDKWMTIGGSDIHPPTEVLGKIQVDPI